MRLEQELIGFEVRDEVLMLAVSSVDPL